MTTKDEFEKELEQLCAKYLDEDDVSKDDISDVLTAVKHRVSWKKGYPES